MKHEKYSEKNISYILEKQRLNVKFNGCIYKITKNKRMTEGIRIKSRCQSMVIIQEPHSSAKHLLALVNSAKCLPYACVREEGQGLDGLGPWSP